MRTDSGFPLFKAGYQFQVLFQELPGYESCHFLLVIKTKFLSRNYQDQVSHSSLVIKFKVVWTRNYQGIRVPTLYWLLNSSYFPGITKISGFPLFTGY